MPSPFDGIDTSDPCAVWPLLNQAYLNLISGQTRTRVRFGQDEVTFTEADAGRLQREASRLKGLCEGKSQRRRAFRGGFR